jgi:ATP phosphoribosyltransferase regulatory subunit
MPFLFKEAVMYTSEAPAGMRDTAGTEEWKKKILQEKIEKVFTSYGYEPVMTPTIEYYETYARAYQNIREEEFYKFFDQDGHILALRPDMTIPIARFTAGRLGSQKPPFRFCYSANVFKVRHSFAGRRNEVTDCGVECIGPGEESDAEVLMLALDAMKCLGTDHYQLEIGSSGFFKAAARYAGLRQEEMETLADLVDRKAMVDLQEFLEASSLSEKGMDFFMKLPLLSGDRTVLTEAQKLSFCPELNEEISRLMELDQMLSDLGRGSQIRYDLGKVPHLTYYTGIIFEGWVEGIGSSVLSGGRYDDLLKKFGRDLPACGFGIKIDEAAEHMHVEAPHVRKVRYPHGRMKEALMTAEELRQTGPVVIEEADVPEVEADA